MSTQPAKSTAKHLPTPSVSKLREPQSRRKLGAAGEELAARYLLDAGLRVVKRNWRCTGQNLPGEIDIVVEENAADLLQGGASVPWCVLVEVRTRRGNAFGTALQSITPQKERRMRALASAYVQEQAWTGPWRIDVVAVQMDSAGRVLEVMHIRGAVQGA